MSKEKYCELIDKLCWRLGIHDSKAMHEACNFQIKNIPFTLLYGGKLDQDSLYVYCNFGEPPAEQKKLALQRLMESNPGLFGHNAQNYGFNVQTGSLLQMSRMSLLETEIESLMRVLDSLSSYAQMWRQNAFHQPTDISEMSS